MYRAVTLALALFGACLQTGCGNGPTTPTQADYRIGQDRNGPTTSISSAISSGPKTLPSEYRILAKHLAQSLKSDFKDFRNNKGMAEIIAEGHSAVMDLRGVKSNDADINYIATQGESACADAVRRMERINSLPKPQDVGSLMVESFLHGLYGNVYAGYALGTDADNKQKAISVEVEGLIGAVEKADAAQILLPKVAEKYAAPMSSNTGRIVVDFDESWGAWGPYDYCCLYNKGADLEDCTVLVEMKGAKGDVRKNVHYVQRWASNSWMIARYDPGTKLLGRDVGRMTVYDVSTVEATVLSPKFSTKVNYVYEGAEKDKDVARRCKELTVSWRYQPFKEGVFGGAFGNTERGVIMAINDVPYVNKCRVDVNFIRGSLNKEYYWSLDSWKQDEEKTFVTSAGNLTYDPEKIEVVISFPGTNHKERFTLKVDK